MRRRERKNGSAARETPFTPKLRSDRQPVKGPEQVSLQCDIQTSASHYNHVARDMHPQPLQSHHDITISSHWLERYSHRPLYDMLLILLFETLPYFHCDSSGAHSCGHNAISLLPVCVIGHRAPTEPVHRKLQRHREGPQQLSKMYALLTPSLFGIRNCHLININ